MFICAGDTGFRLEFGPRVAQIWRMLELIQIPWSPFCIVQRRLLEAAGAKFKVVNLLRSLDRNLIWKLTAERYHAVPIVKDGAKVIYESGDDTQDIARYLDAKLGLQLFPEELEGQQFILWHYFEHEVEGVGFRLNDIHYREFVAKDEWVFFVRHKERKFGAGCIEQWRANQKDLLAQWVAKLRPAEQMLAHAPYLLGDRVRFVDFNLFGMVENFLFSGHFKLPQSLPHLRRWHAEMKTVKVGPGRAA